MWMLPAAIVVSIFGSLGWHWFRHFNNHSQDSDTGSSKLRHDYFRGLNYLINEQPDKAVDVFIHLLEVDTDTVEMHLALGNLFRQRGEVDRAIRIHQNLIARPQLKKSHRLQALSALGEDYLRAGVLDRAEKIFLELVSLGDDNHRGLHFLLDIYQREKEWLKAIEIAKKLTLERRNETKMMIAQFYCELALQMKAKGHLIEAKDFLKRAERADQYCVRASLLQGNIAQQAHDYSLAIHCYLRVTKHNTAFISEVVNPVVQCYEALRDDDSLKTFLMRALDAYPSDHVIFAISKFLQRTEGSKVAISFLTEQIKLTSSLRGLTHLVDLYVLNSEGETKEKLKILGKLIRSHVEDMPLYQCGQCGFSSRSLSWLCPGCHRWVTVKPLHG